MFSISLLKINDWFHYNEMFSFLLQVCERSELAKKVKLARKTVKLAKKSETCEPWERKWDR
jgi:hypothetical protein